MKIAIIGWGSLIWNPAGLPHDGRWRTDGPTLPVEFSRISPDGRLTLVIDPVDGSEVATHWSVSPRGRLDEAVIDLASRERCGRDDIGFVDGENGRHSRLRFPRQRDVLSVLRPWCGHSGVDAAVWTALPPTFEERTGTPYSVTAALDYLDSLRGPLRRTALTYVRNAPAGVATPFRRAFDACRRFRTDR